MILILKNLKIIIINYSFNLKEVFFFFLENVVDLYFNNIYYLGQNLKI